MDFNLDNETLINIGLAVGAILILIVIVYGINRLFKFIYKTTKRIYN